MRLRIAAILMGLGLAVAGATSPAHASLPAEGVWSVQPVSAKAAAHVGPAGYVTFWDGCPVGYCGAAWPLSPGSGHVCREVPVGSNDKASAVDNNSSWNITFYQNTACTGASYIFYAGTMDGQLTNGTPPGQGNNSYTSFYFWGR